MIHYYRGKDKDGKWHYGYYVKLNDSHFIYTGYADTDCGEYFPDAYEVDGKTVTEMTGYCDKYDDEIYDGDICEIVMEYKDDIDIFGGYVVCQVICLENGNFVFESSDNLFHNQFYRNVNDSRIVTENIEIIGNIFDNPELLELSKGD